MSGNRLKPCCSKSAKTDNVHESWSIALIIDFEKVSFKGHGLVSIAQILLVLYGKSSVIRQKGESQNGGNKKAKHTKFSEKQTFLTP